MEQKQKEQKTNEEKDWQCGRFEPSSGIGKMMMKMMKKMCDKSNVCCWPEVSDNSQTELNKSGPKINNDCC